MGVVGLIYVRDWEGPGGGHHAFLNFFCFCDEVNCSMVYGGCCVSLFLCSFLLSLCLALLIECC